MSHIFIRHGNRESMKDIDSLLTTQGRHNSAIKADELIEKYGVPDVIITSPYVRTRETAGIMNMQLQEPVDIIVDPRLSEYSTSKTPLTGNLTEVTASYNPPDVYYEPYNRVLELYNEYSKHDSHIWFVTHGSIIVTVLEIISNGKVKLNGVPYLSSIHMTDKKVEMIFGHGINAKSRKWNF